MKLNFIGGVVAVLVFAALIVVYSALFTVYQTQQALVVRWARSCAWSNEPGLHVKLPFIDNVIDIDKRILDLEAPAQEVIASDQKRLVVDAFARYRIHDPLRFYQTLGSKFAADSQLASLLNSALRRVLGEATFIQVVRDQRAELMARIRDLINHEAESYGIQVVDARIRRADLPEQNSQAVYQRMQTERQREAAEYRAQGLQRAQEIRSKADREVTVLVADATSKSEQIRGEGDATRNQIFADAFNQDPDFFAFYRSMQAYEAGPQDPPIRGSCSSRTPISSATSTIRPASRPRRRRRRPPPANIAAHRRYDGFPGRARTGLRDRGPGVCRLSGAGQAGDGERHGNAGGDLARDRHRLGRRRADLGVAGDGSAGPASACFAGESASRGVDGRCP